jgi:hypothetical protein
MKDETVIKRAKGGRPVKKIKRDRHIRVRLTATEHFRIEDKAIRAKLTISEWFRKAALKGKVRARISIEEMNYFRTLSGMANNLNQLTKLAHSQGLLIVQRKCRELIDQIGELIKKGDKDDR